jgi:hypothetical protein
MGVQSLTMSSHGLKADVLARLKSELCGPSALFRHTVMVETASAYQVYIDLAMSTVDLNVRLVGDIRASRCGEIERNLPVLGVERCVWRDVVILHTSPPLSMTLPEEAGMRHRGPW